ncbi:MAG TPA: TonB family protein [Phenylobacterium sp.]|uniref:TonB family protein n=1 Tax=Phenylobacterium sp. TaxID=1871053 RepID=UPI002B67E441|nr:TonB family protein [Phenylobacterium sp.]HSV02838.1 TonB family protein [Phenylobacterium sp.]
MRRAWTWLAGGLVAAGLASSAAAQGVGGVASLDCRVRADGRLADCRVVSEAPRGQGLGKAALRMAGRIRMNPVSRGGRPTAGARVTIPIRFGPTARR